MSLSIVSGLKIRLRSEALAYGLIRKIDHLIEQKKFIRVKYVCHFILLLKPKSSNLKATLAYIAQQQKQYSLAIKLASEALGHDSSNETAYLVLGVSASAIGQHQEAAVALEQAAESNPDYTQGIVLAINEAIHIGDMNAVDRIYRFSPKALSDASIISAYVNALIQSGRQALLADSLTKTDPKIDVFTLASVAGWSRNHGVEVFPAGEIENIGVDTPTTFDGSKFQPGKPQMVHGNLPYTVELRDVTILSKSSVIFTLDGFALNDLATHPEFGSLINLSADPAVISRNGAYILARISDYKILRHSGGIWLSGSVSKAYGHFVPESLTKLQFLEQHPAFSELPIIVDQVMPDSHFEYLSCIVDNPIIRLPPGQGLLCDRLLVAPMPTFHPGEVTLESRLLKQQNCLSPRGLRYLQSRVLAKVDGTSHFKRRIYLSRRNMQWRLLENDLQIGNWLESIGFEKVYIEQFSFFDQVRMFRDAECIVAPNGSALLNTIFAPTSLKLVILSQPDVLEWSGFNGPIRMLGYNPLFVVGTENSGDKHANYRVPLSRLKKSLKQLGL